LVAMDSAPNRLTSVAHHNVLGEIICSSRIRRSLKSSMPAARRDRANQHLD
jgi:hypothetical protein